MAIIRSSDDTFLPPPALDAETVSRFGLSILLDLGGIAQVWPYLHHGTSSERLMQMLGLSEQAEGINNKAKFEELLKAHQIKLGGFTGGFGPVLDESLWRIAETVGLSESERQVLGLATLVNAHDCLAKLASKAFGEMDFLGLVKICSTLLAESPSNVRTALSPTGLLVRSGLLGINRKARHRFHEKFLLLDGLVEALCTGADEISGLIARWIPVAAAPTLTLKDYPHCREVVTLAHRLVRASLKTGRVGVNVLLFGPPGTGKTELARALASALGVVLYTVPTADDDGDPISGVKRLRCYRLAQTVLSRRDQALLLFDEVEDVFPHPMGVRFGNTELTKGWINATLEDNPLPAIWICNSIAGLDEAYLRRFTQVIEVGIPPLPVRERLIQTQTRDLPVSSTWQRRVARHPEVSPALLRQAVRTVAAADYRRTETTEAALETLLNSTLSAMGRAPLPRALATDVMRYRPDCLNADQDLDALVRGLRRDPRGRMCCYGPPGTGKSAFGIHLARSLQRPLLVKRASDLLNLYVGESEKNLARMFREANAESAVLLLDEADSFLRDRRAVRASWEATQVNELLTQMENFDGVFIASTNLFETLDAAALRRFDLKIRFDYLRPEQAWTLFQETLRQTGGRLTQPLIWQTRLSKLERLTPGDFAIQMRRQRFAPVQLTPQMLFEGLASDVGLKRREAVSQRPIGFQADL